MRVSFASLSCLDLAERNCARVVLVIGTFLSFNMHPSLLTRESLADFDTNKPHITINRIVYFIS